jgi:hypothetical protein
LIEFALLNSKDKKVKTHQDLLPSGMVSSEVVQLANYGNLTLEYDDNNIKELDKYSVSEPLMTAVHDLARLHPSRPPQLRGGDCQDA